MIAEAETQTRKGTTMKPYQLAFNGPEDISFHVVEEFQAVDDDAANAWAEANEARMDEEYNNTEWYVLDADGRNING